MRLPLPAAALLGLVTAWLAPAEAHRDGPELPADPSAPGDAACAVCHPGAAKALRQTPHAFVLTDARYRDRACTVCHSDAGAHGAAAVDPRAEPVAPPPVAAPACATCHGEAAHAPAAAAHPWVAAPNLDEVMAAPDPRAALEEPGGFLGLDWSGLIAVGYRFVDVDGSLDRYDTDINLDDGLRMPELEIEGMGSAGWADLLRFRAENVGDPYGRADLLLEKDELYRGRARYRETEIKYLASGDYHRVVRNGEEKGADLAFDLSDSVELFGSYTRLDEDAFWLTNRIGNLNVLPLTTIAGVESPRSLESHLAELGISGTLSDIDTTYTVAFEYRDDDLDESWSYAQPSPINPAFNESENFTSRSSLAGPGGRFALGHRSGGFTADVTGRVLDLEREVTGDGVRTGFDIGEFVTTTDSDSTGDARTWLLDATVGLELADWITLLGDLRYADHREDFSIRQFDTTVYPTLGTTTTVPTILDQHTEQQQLEGSVQADVAPADWLDLTLGYGFSREYLEVPDLQAGDPDFTSGHIRDNGLIAGAQWRPNQHWVVAAEYRDFGQSGIQLYEIQADESRRSRASVRYQTDGFWTEAFYLYRRRKNDVVPSHTDSDSAGLTASVVRGEGLDLYLSYVFSDIDSQTLTNFYFDPDPNPVPTIVGFQGRTNTVSAGLGAHPGERVTWRLDGVYTDTRGSFDVRLWDWRTDVAVRVLPGGEAGVELRWVDYDEAGGADDYRALLTMIYWRQRLGR